MRRPGPTITVKEPMSGRDKRDVWVTLILAIYNFGLMAGATWLVLEHQWSMWTYALAYLAAGSDKRKDEKNGK